MKLIDVKTSTYNDLDGQPNIKDFKFKVGDHVRISKHKSIFAKDYKRNWLEDIFFLYYDRIDRCEGIHVNKTKESREYIICNYYYFLKVNFIFQPKLCNGCHNLMPKTMSFNIAIVSVKENVYRTDFWYMSRDEAINRISNNTYLNKKSGSL